MLVTTVLLAVGVVALAVVAVRQRTELTSLRDAVALPDPGEDPLTGHDAIVVTIHNHDEVAASRNRLAPTLSLVSPRLVRTVVHRETVSELRTQLAAEGVAADVRVRRIVPWNRTG